MLPFLLIFIFKIQVGLEMTLIDWGYEENLHKTECQRTKALADKSSKGQKPQRTTAPCASINSKL